MESSHIIRRADAKSSALNVYSNWVCYMDGIAILIPAYNEAKTICSVVDRCSLYSKNIIVIDDGSTDNTVAQIKNTAASIFSNLKNIGKGATLLKGFQIAIEKNYCGVISLDADGQHDPDDLPRFFDIIQKNPDAFIIGARKIAANCAPKLRLWANKMADFFISCAARKPLCDTQSGYRYYPISFLKKVVTATHLANHFAFETEILVAAVRSGLPVDYVAIRSCYPAGARMSHYHPRKDTWAITKTVTRLLFKS